MNATSITCTALLCATFAAAPGALAGASRAAVDADLGRAVRAGTFPIYDNGLMPRDIDPQAYPPAAASLRTTRDQVQAELHRAVRDGDLPVYDNGATPRELEPWAYAGPASVTGTGTASEDLPQHVVNAP